MRSINARVLEPMLEEDAKKFGKEFKIENYQGSAGWLEKFKLWYEISQKVLWRELNKVSAEVMEKFTEKFPEFAKSFKDEDIFNADECGLFFKAMPNWSLVMIGRCLQKKKTLKAVLYCSPMS